MNKAYNTVVFDFGGVLIDWNRKYMYRKVFKDEQEMEWFLENVCTLEWNNLQDEGFPFSETIPALQKKFPKYTDEIAMYEQRWSEMVGGEITGTVNILQELQAKKLPAYGLTNWGADTFPIVYNQFEFLRKLDGIVVSGDEKLVKPNPALFQILIDRFELTPQKTIFIDDNSRNIETAQQMGFKIIPFVTPEALRETLEQLDIL